MGAVTTAAIVGWREKLLDLSKRNRLIQSGPARSNLVRIELPQLTTLWQRMVISGKKLVFPWQAELVSGDGLEASAPARFGAEAAVDQGSPNQPVSNQEVDYFEACASSPLLTADHVLTRITDKTLARRLQRLALNSKTSLSEQGVNTLFVAFGLLKWFESKDSDVPLFSPLLLVPAGLSRPSLDSRWELCTVEEEVVSNQCLIQVLVEQFGIRLPEIDEEPLLESVSQVLSFMREVRERIEEHPRWELLDEVLLGNFAFQKLAMWNDVEVNKGAIAEHPVCKALAGENEEPLAPDGVSPPRASQLDDLVHPKDAFHILPCDSSQQEAIEAVKSGVSLIIDGPPGTGKSQTIANVIAECLAQGKRVLFVSEKMAALEVVKRRLDQSGLGDFCLECHSHKANKKSVVAELGRRLGLRPDAPAAQAPSMEDLYRERSRLNAYVRALHHQRGALNVTAYQVHGRLAALLNEPILRCHIPKPLEIDQAMLQEMKHATAAAVDCGAVLTNRARHPWRNSTQTSRSLTLESDIQHHFGALARVLANCSRPVESMTRLGFVVDRPTVPELEAASNAVRTILGFPMIPRGWFVHGLRVTAERYLGLERAAEEFRKMRGLVPQYSDAAVDAAWPEFESNIRRTEAVRRTLSPDICKTVRDSLEKLELLIGKIQRAAELTTSCRSLATAVVNTLGVPLTAEPTPSDLTKLVEVARTVARLGCPHDSWFDPFRRRDLREIAERGKAAARAISSERIKLQATFLEVAFDPETAGVLATCGRYEGILGAIRRGWGRCRTALLSLYARNAPGKRAILLRDAHELSDHLRRTARLLEVGQSQGPALRATSLGNVEWDAVLADFALLDRLESTIRPARGLQDALLRGTIDRDSLTGLAQKLDAEKSLLAAEVGRLGECIRIARAGDTTSMLATTGLNVLRQSLDEHIAPLIELRTTLYAVTSIIKEGEDVQIPDLIEHAHTFQSLRRARDRVRREFAELAAVGPPIGNPEETDWGGTAEIARPALRFSDLFNDSPPGHVIAAASDTAIRAQLTEAASALIELLGEQFRESMGFLRSIFPMDEDVSTGIVLSGSPLGVLILWLQARAQDASRITEWIQFRSVDEQLRRLGIGGFLAEVSDGTVPLHHAEPAFLARFYRLWLDAAYSGDAALAQFQVENHERLIARFRALDRDHIENNYQRVRSRCFQTATDYDSSNIPSSSELGILLREVNKKKRHLPLRVLFKRIAGLLQRLKPCMMMSPLAVSTYLDSPDIRFDLVVFDEASQVRPHDAVCAIYRARQLLVAGDQKQLPPTNFFERQDRGDDGEAIEEEGGNLSEFESILDVCATLKLPRKRLQWHYRSRRESLIAFSNQHFYGGELITFPSAQEADGTAGVQLEYVADGRWQSGSTGGFNEAEAVRTADLVFEHLRTGSKLSLGVITMNQRQQLLVTDEIDKRRRQHPELEWYFDSGREEPFFVKNLENVQGDERDVVFLSVGYARNQSGEMLMYFGPLNVDGGERRLNVAVTRARHGLVMISSIRASDIDLARANSAGARLLRAYLDYAERGADALRGSVSDNESHSPDSLFEVEVARELSGRGLDVRRQVGCGRYRIDLALVDPKQPGRYVLGIECDGATYHSSSTARDRDRLRQSVLEGLGWRICRIWSTDWVQSRERQVRRVLDAYEKSLGDAHGGQDFVPTQPQPEPKPKLQAEPLPRVAGRNGNGSTAPQSRYSRIEDVPSYEIEALVSRILSQAGATDEEGLITHIARQLGFQRTGARINRKIGYMINSLQGREVIERDPDGRLRLKRQVRSS